MKQMFLRSLWPNHVWRDITFDTTVVILILISYIKFEMTIILSLPLFILFGFRLYLSVVEYAIFQRPENYRKDTLKAIGWTTETCNVMGIEITYHISKGKQSKPTIFFIHGWRSSSGRMLNRIEHFVNIGWTVCAIDLPNHGNSGAVAKWSAEFSTTCVIDVLNRFDYSDTNQKIIFYGHSLGGFIVMRLFKRAKEIRVSNQIEAIVLESPMTRYSYIIEENFERNNMMQLVKKVLMKRIITTVQRLNTVTNEFHSIEDADIPSWGLPKVPTLVVQAENDDVLGTKHYEALIESMRDHDIKFEHHVVPSLSHSGIDVHEERDALTSKFIRELDDLFL